MDRLAVGFILNFKKISIMNADAKFLSDSAFLLLQLFGMSHLLDQLMGLRVWYLKGFN